MRAWVSFSSTAALLGSACVLASAGAAGAAAVAYGGGGYARVCSDAAIRGSMMPSHLQACTTALEEEALAPEARAATHVNRGVLRMRRGDRESARSDFDRALSLGHHQGEAYVNRGALLMVEHRYQEGLADTERALQLDMSEPQRAWFNRGIAYEELGDMLAAYQSYRRAAELAPSWAEPRRELARFQVRQGG